MSLTSFVGREQEMKLVQQLLAAHRLVTLVGPPGTGKTRLALEAATAVAAEFANGVFFVQLAPLSDPNLVIASIAQAIGIQVPGVQTPFDRLVDALQKRRLLLVLDNFEHVVAAALPVAELLGAVPGPKILVTSRVALRVRGEQIFPVPPLAVPGRIKLLSAGAEIDPILDAYPAIQLFRDRARAVRPDFGLMPDNVEAIAELCRRLDGLPLAIELAAARSTVLSPAAMLTRLEQHVPLLTGGAHDLPARQQTLGAAITWSYNLLDRTEQSFFRRLGVFVGGWTLEAAEAVCSGALGPGSWVMGGREEPSAASPSRTQAPVPNTASDTLERLESLVRKSLVQAHERPEIGKAAEPRFGMFETLRDYTWERLTEIGEIAAMRRRHASYFLALAEEGGPRVYGPDAELWLDRLERDHDNYRAALRWAEETGEAEISLRLGAALYRFWWVRGHVGEGQQWLLRALATEIGSQPADSPGTRRARAWALHAVAALISNGGGDSRVSRALLEESLALQRTLGDKKSIANCLHNLAMVVDDQGEYTAARSLFDESLGIWRELGDPWGLAVVLRAMSELAVNEEDYERARRDIAECQIHAHSTQDTMHLALVSAMSGWIDKWQGRLDSARHHMEDSAVQLRAMGAQHSYTYVVLQAFLARVYLKTGDAEAARTALRESLSVAREQGVRGITAARILEAALLLVVAQGHPVRTLRLAGAAAAIRRSSGTPLPAADRKELDASLDLARSVVGEAEAALAWAAGEAMTPERAIAYALEGGE
jgi:predicted ATPase